MAVELERRRVARERNHTTTYFRDRVRVDDVPGRRVFAVLAELH